MSPDVYTLKIDINIVQLLCTCINYIRLENKQLFPVNYSMRSNLTDI